MRKAIVVLVLLLALVPNLILAQDTAVQNITTESVQISWPAPVTELWGTTEILGTASVPNMAYYYLEYLSLNDDLSLPTNAPWLPATVGLTQPVINSSLAALDTTNFADGVYALRLTVNTNDGQTFHHIIAPIRVDNERFNAILAGTGQEEPPEPQPTQVPQDTRAKVSPSGTNYSINVRRCDMVDNDRCPVIGTLQAGEVALVQALSSNRTGWFEIQLPSGAVGWVSPTVVSQQGDFASVGFAQPPAPLPPVSRPQPVQPPISAPVTQPSGVVPNAVVIEGGTATCNRTFNVQVNVINSGSSVSPAGTVTLQDVNIGTGEVTFTGYGNYPSLNPGANFVVVIPTNTSVHYNEDHELRAYTNGRQFNNRYQLQRGDCGQAPRPPQDSQPRTQRSFGIDECRLNVADNGEAYSSPEGGEVAVLLPAGTYPARQIKRVGGLNWYELSFADATTWLSTAILGTQGNCGL